MTVDDGLLKQRFRTLYGDELYHDDVGIGHIAFSDLNIILDEARADFPVYPKDTTAKETWQEIVDFYVELTSKRDKWFVKWFGASK
jgi:hypothetical protein